MLDLAPLSTLDKRGARSSRPNPDADRSRFAMPSTVPETPAIVAETPWLTPDETAAYLKVSRRCLREMARDGRLTRYELGHKVVRFHADDVRAAFGRPE
jgi:excisionase family DNA binding protein